MNSNEDRDWRAAAFRRANASSALEGMHATPDDLALQQRVIDGELTSEQACQVVIEKVRKRQAAKRHTS
ncbi:MAG TPA: antitoxin VbhA family protein [Candidatus Baltobacteraceae bacterium]|jgi:hypothetical protein|nr:antitoxin VbhA family protein [Candidatus Baltobacteraceae bacterium]